MSFRFRFDEDRTIQAVAALLRHRGGCENYTWLIKVLYFAERECLKETGQPLTGARVIAMENGTVLEDIYRLIRKPELSGNWSAHFAKVNTYDLRMVCDPGDGRMTDYQMEKIAEVAERFKDCDWKEMVRRTHLELEEWKRNDPGESSQPPLSAGVRPARRD